MLKGETEKLPDMLRENLRLVFVGTAASNRSAADGHYYAHPGNRFWNAIHEVGLTGRRYQPAEFRELLPLGIGFTDLNKSEAGMDHQLSAGSIDVAAFRAKIEKFRPDAIAFTSKKAASYFYGKPTSAIAFGRQPPSQGFCDVFVLTSPSGAASGHWSLQPWQELAAWFLSTEPRQAMAIKHFPAPAGIKAPPLSFAARSGDHLFVSGIPGFDAQGNLPDTFEAQFANVVTNIKRILTEAGVTMRDLVKVNVLLTRASDVARMNELYASAFGPAPYPARTTCVVVALPNPAMLIEIECVAAVKS
jgi:double-stranded uracil-DNA glycosylase